MKAWVRWVAKQGASADAKQFCSVTTIKKKKEIIINKDTFHCDLFLPFPKEPNIKGYVSLTFKDPEKPIRKLRIRFPEKNNLKTFVNSINKMQRGETTWKEPEQEWLVSVKNTLEMLPRITGLEHHTLFHIYVDSEIINLSGETPKGSDEEIVRGKSAALVRRYFPDVSDCSMKSNIAMLKYIKKFRTEIIPKEEEEESSGPESEDEELFPGSREPRESSLPQNSARLFGTSFSDSFSQPSLHDLISHLTGLPSSSSLTDRLEAESSFVRGNINIPLTEMDSALTLTQSIATGGEDYSRNIVCKTETVAEMQEPTLFHGAAIETTTGGFQIQENLGLVNETSDESVCQPAEEVSNTASGSAYIVSIASEQIETASTESVPKTKKTAKRCLPLPSPDLFAKRNCLGNAISASVLLPNSLLRIQSQVEETSSIVCPTDRSVFPEVSEPDCASPLMSVSMLESSNENDKRVEATYIDTTTCISDENQTQNLGDASNHISQEAAEVSTENAVQEEECEDVKPTVSDISIKDECSTDEDSLNWSTFGGIITSNQVPREQELLKLRVDAAVDNTFFMLYTHPRRNEIAREIGRKLRDGFSALAKEERLDSFGRISSHSQGLELLPQDGFEARLKRMFALFDEFLTEPPFFEYCHCCLTGEYLKAADVEKHINTNTHLKRLRNFTIGYEYDQKLQFRVTNCDLKRSKELLSKVKFPTTYSSVRNLLKDHAVCIETVLDIICHINSSATVEGTANEDEDDIQIIGFVKKDAKRMGVLESRPGRDGVKKEEPIDDSCEPSQPPVSAEYSPHLNKVPDNVEENTVNNDNNSDV